MPWCPKCKNEYVEGVTVCADCGCPLVETLEEGGQILYLGAAEDCRQLADFLICNGIRSASVGISESSESFAVTVDSSQGQKAERIATVFWKEKEKEGWSQPPREQEDAEEPDEDDEEAYPDDFPNAVHLGRAMRGQQSTGVYEAASKKAEEFKSGAYTLLIVGIAGMIGLGLLLSGVLPVRLDPSSQFLTCLVMAALFLVFIVMGVLSFRSWREQEGKAVRESSLKEELTRYCRENLDPASIDLDAGVGADDPEEVRYFKRMERMKLRISENFLNLEEGYLESFLDEIYPSLFDDSEETGKGL